MFDVTLLAVTKVIVAVLVGAYTANTIPHRASTIRDFSFLISDVLLPCLTIANTAKSVTVELLVRCSVLIFFALLLISIGVVTALIMSAVLFRTPKGKAGIPLELQKDVCLELRYEPVPDGGALTATGQQPEARSSKKSHRGTPYVAVVLSEDLRARGVVGEDVVPALDVPSPELDVLPGYFWGSLVGCSIQNTVTLPLSLLQNLADSVPWLQFEQGSAYIFVFSTVCTLYLWSFGPTYVETAQKRSEELRLVRELVTQHKRREQQCDAFTQTEVQVNSTFSPAVQDGAVPPFPPRRATSGDRGSDHADDAVADGADEGAYPLPHASVHSTKTERADALRGSFSSTSSSTTSSRVMHQGSQADFGSPSSAKVPKFFSPTEALAGQVPYDWREAGLLRPVDAAAATADAKGESRVTAFLKAVKSLGWRLLTNVPFMAIVVSIFIGITPPIRGLFFDGGALELLMDSVTMISQGSIPSSLLLLGVNLAGSTGSQASDDPNAQRQLRHSEQNTDFPLYAQDLELVGEDASHARAYNEQHARLHSGADDDQSSDGEFDQHASFTLQDLIQRSASAREREAEARFQQEQRLMHASSSGVQTDGRSNGVLVSATDARAAAPTLNDTKDEAAPTAGVCERVVGALNVEGVRKTFIWGTIAIRLVILPAISFLLLIALIKGVPSLFGPPGRPDKTLILVLFLELAAPTAINSALLFNQRQYMTYPWAKMLFFQYILCSFTLVMWATIGLATVQAL